MINKFFFLLQKGIFVDSQKYKKLKDKDIYFIKIPDGRKWISVFHTLDRQTGHFATWLDHCIGSKDAYYDKMMGETAYLCNLHDIKEIRLATKQEAELLLTLKVENRPDIIEIINNYINTLNDECK